MGTMQAESESSHPMLVRDAMSTELLTVHPHHNLSEAARLMSARRVGAAVVVDDAMPGPGMITERDVMRAVADGRDPASTEVGDVMTFEARAASTDWDLDTAAAEMIRGNFRHLVIVDGRGALVGILSMRDIVRARLPAAVRVGTLPNEARR